MAGLCLLTLQRSLLTGDLPLPPSRLPKHLQHSAWGSISMLPFTFEEISGVNRRETNLGNRNKARSKRTLYKKTLQRKEEVTSMEPQQEGTRKGHAEKKKELLEIKEI